MQYGHPAWWGKMKRFVIAAFLCVWCALLPAFSQSASTWNKQEFLESVRNTASTEGSEAALGLYKGIPARYADDYDIFFLRAKLLYDVERYIDAKSICDKLMMDPANAGKKELQDLVSLIEATGQAVSPAQNWTKEQFINEVWTRAANDGIPQALTLYEGIPARFVGDYDIFFLETRLLTALGQYDDAYSVALMVKKIKNTSELQELMIRIDRGRFLTSLQRELNTGSAQNALALFDTMPASVKNDFELLFLKASIMVSAGMVDEAEALCAQLEAQKPGDVDLLSLRLAIADMRGDQKTKSTMIMKIIQADPYNSTANVELAEQAVVKKSYPKALELYKKALVNDPTNESALLGIGLANYYLENDDEAKEVLNQLLEQNPYNAQAHSYLGKIAYANREYRTAVSEVEKAISLDASNYDYWTDYGLYLRYVGRYDEAAEAWTHATTIEPDYFLAYVYRAGLYDEQEMIPQALEDYRKVVQLNPKYYYAYESIGILSLHEKDWKTAREAFMKCREYNADSISYPLLITYCYYKEGNKLEAKNYSNQVLRKMDRNTIEYAMLRVFHDEAGEMPLPQRIAALPSMNERAKMYFYLGLFYDMFGGREYANDYYAKVLSLNSPMFFEYRLAEWSVAAGNESE